MTEARADVQIRALRVEEAEAFAAVQRRVFPEYMTSRLGHRYSVAFFREYARTDGVIALGGWRNEQLLGFVTGCHASVESRIHRGLLGRAALAALVRPWLLASPHGWKRMMRIVRRRPASADETKPDRTREDWVKIPSLAVLPAALFVVRGLGLGTRLLDAVCSEAASRGFHQAWCMCRWDNHAIHRVLDKHGWAAVPGSEPHAPICFTVNLASRERSTSV